MSGGVASWLSVRAGGFGIGSAGVMGDGAPPSDTWRSWKGPGLGLAWAAGPSFGLSFGLLFWHLTSFGLSLSKMPLSLISSTKPHLFILHFSSKTDLKVAPQYRDLIDMLKLLVALHTLRVCFNIICDYTLARNNLSPN